MIVNCPGHVNTWLCVSISRTKCNSCQGSYTMKRMWKGYSYQHFSNNFMHDTRMQRARYDTVVMGIIAWTPSLCHTACTAGIGHTACTVDIGHTACITVIGHTVCTACIGHTACTAVMCHMLCASGMYTSHVQRKALSSYWQRAIVLKCCRCYLLSATRVFFNPVSIPYVRKYCLCFPLVVLKLPYWSRVHIS